ncbi:hypothetical protein EIP91_000856 [Steccherinum ochraceum]|uniref:Uncharacterized protein n=1 Tax=Steccherinum ochraceum TaxID=92696 RepID=A0A4R0RQ05_9APHY|nr:hypothetical protein EIP91_000856 [Steccherinum ochraceum]
MVSGSPSHASDGPRADELDSPPTSEEQLVGWRAEPADVIDCQLSEDDDEDLSQWQPRESLPRAYLPTQQNPRPPLVQFGLPVATETLLSYAKKLEVALPGSFPPLNARRCADPAFLAGHISLHLRKQYSFKLWYANAYKLPEGTNVLIQLCSNYSVQEKGGQHKVVEAVELVKRELGLEPELQARWYCDRRWDSPRIYDDIDVWKQRFAH